MIWWERNTQGLSSPCIERGIYVWNSKVLPDLPSGALALIDANTSPGNIIVTVWPGNYDDKGVNVELVEPAEDFPSETLLAQIMLVA